MVNKNEDNRRAVESYLRTKDLEDTAIFGIMGVMRDGGSFDYQIKTIRRSRVRFVSVRSGWRSR